MDFVRDSTETGVLCRFVYKFELEFNNYIVIRITDNGHNDKSPETPCSNKPTIYIPTYLLGYYKCKLDLVAGIFYII